MVMMQKKNHNVVEMRMVHRVAQVAFLGVFCNLSNSAHAFSTAAVKRCEDPFVTRVLLLQEDDDDDTNHHDVVLDLQAARGLSVWRKILLKGRLPVATDFVVDQQWPVEPILGQAVQDAMIELQLPRFVHRRPETINSVLICLMRLVRKFEKAVNELADQDRMEKDDDADNRSETFDETVSLKSFEDDLTQDHLRVLAEELVAEGLVNEFEGPVAGMQTIDQMFGYNHGIEFGLADGVWDHTGWKAIPELQRQLSTMPELARLMKQLGRRPTAAASDSVHKFRKRKLDPHGADGAEVNLQARSQVTGLTLSNSLQDMLPSEAVLLRGSPVLRRLFWAKQVESKLQSYELSGWLDSPSIPKEKSRRARMPSAPGGPLIVCLDTSWSMEPREWLTKAVVFACVTAAFKQKRACQLVSFSNGIVVASELSADVVGVRNLLDFLSYSFGGGTDVTAPLRFTIESIKRDAMAAADLILVSDGEIPQVSKDMQTILNGLKKSTGLRIHGLLMGTRESSALTTLCTHIHTFLMDSEAESLAAWAKPSVGYAALKYQPNGSVECQGFQQVGWCRKKNACRQTLPLKARRNKRDYDTSKRKGDRSKRSFDDDDDDWYESTRASTRTESNDDSASTSSTSDGFHLLVNKALADIEMSFTREVADQSWQPQTLYDERNSTRSCWQYHSQLLNAVAYISENLVERDEEARLIVLGLVAGEHVLFLGPPGTAKSALGRRLSRLCGGPFFQRLLTRFTTPEEIFGPLSLRSLEKDEYIRCTDGFLPKAAVAFLDEIFKANSAILNTLLTILNERQFDNGAGRRQDCPIRCVIAASNELPESDELDALYDRFLIRKEVLPVSDDGIADLIGISSKAGFESELSTLSIPMDDVAEALSASAESVRIGFDAIDLLKDLRTFVREEFDVEVSDRRLLKAARLLRLSASSHGRAYVDPIDCLVLEHIVWETPDQRSSIKEWLWNHLTPGSDSYQFHILLNSHRQDALSLVRKTSGDVTGSGGAAQSYILAIKALREELSQIAGLLEQQADSIFRHTALLDQSTDHLWLSPDDALACKQFLIPKAHAALEETQLAFKHSKSLWLALSSDLEPGACSDNVRSAVIEQLWNDDDTSTEYKFSENELQIGMKEAKAKYDGDTFRKWKRERRKAKL